MAIRSGETYKCEVQVCPMNISSIEGKGVIPQPEACDLFIGQLTLPASSQFEYKADWSGTGIVVPQAPALLLPDEVSFVKQHQELLEDVWHAGEDSGDGPTAVAAPMTMPQLQQQVEARLLTRKWTCSTIVTGSTTTAAVIGLCLWRHRRALLVFRARCARKRTIADNIKGNSPALRKDESKGETDSEMAAGGDQKTKDLGTPSETTVFR